MQRSLRRLSLDTGVLLEYFGGTSVGQKVRQLIEEGGAEFLLSPQVLTELYYIGCRQKGKEYADELFEALVKSVFSVVSSLESALEAGRYKCERAISITDCYVLAIAKLTNGTAVFRREKEILWAAERRPFDVKVAFIEDF